MPDVRDPRWNTMCGDAPGPGDPRVWEDDLEAADNLATQGGILPHNPLHPMEVDGGRSIYFKRCCTNCLHRPADPRLHGQHKLVGEGYGLGTGRSGFESKLYHPVSPEFIRTLPTANISHALTNIRAKPLSKDIWLGNGDKKEWYKSGLVKYSDFEAFDRLRQQTVRSMEAELAARVEDIKRDPAPFATLGIWMDPGWNAPFDHSRSALSHRPSMSTPQRPRFGQVSKSVASSIQERRASTPQQRRVSRLLRLPFFRAEIPSLSISPRNTDSPVDPIKARRRWFSMNDDPDQSKDIPWRWRLHGIKEPWSN